MSPKREEVIVEKIKSVLDYYEWRHKFLLQSLSNDEWLSGQWEPAHDAEYANIRSNSLPFEMKITAIMIHV